MGRYFGLKFINVILELPYSSNIKNWLLTCNKVKNWHGSEQEAREEIIKSLPTKMYPLLKSDSWIIELDSYIYNQQDEFKIELSANTPLNTSILNMNFTISFKENKDHAMQQFLLLIKEYIKSGSILLCIDGTVFKVDYKKDFICDLYMDGGIRVNFPIYSPEELLKISKEEREEIEDGFV